MVSIMPAMSASDSRKQQPGLNVKCRRKEYGTEDKTDGVVDRFSSAGRELMRMSLHWDALKVDFILRKISSAGDAESPE